MSTAGADFDATPSSTAVWTTAVAALVAVALLSVSASTTLAGLAGLALMPTGVRRGSRRLHTFGAAALFAGVLLAGSAGAPTVFVLAATGATVVAWDAGANGIGLGTQLGRRAATGRSQLAHVAATAIVAVLVGAAGYAVFRIARTGQPTSAVVLLLLAALLFTWLLDR